MKNVSDKSYRETRSTHFMFDNFPPPPQNRTVYEIISTFGKNTQQFFTFFHNMWNKLARWKYYNQNEAYKLF